MLVFLLRADLGACFFLFSLLVVHCFSMLYLLSPAGQPLLLRVLLLMEIRLA